jgi:hypothetical protein
MNVSELVAGLGGHSQNAQVIVVETNSPSDNVLSLESVGEGNEKSVLLHGQSLIRKPLETLPAILLQGRSDRVFKVAITKPDEKGGKYQVAIDGTVLQFDFETEQEAKMFVKGYVLGFETGSGDKKFDATKDIRNL